MEDTYLMNAYMAQLNKDESMLIRSLNDYVALKELRYKALENKTFHHDSWLRDMTCGEGESENKFTEGSAEFVEVSYLIALGLVDARDIVETQDYSTFYSSKSSNRFYYTGMLELMLLKEIDPSFKDYASVDYIKQDLSWRELPFFRIKNILSK